MVLDQSRTDNAIENANEAVQGGIGGYVASFFLTESEMGQKP